jgi:hypothetical protein
MLRCASAPFTGCTITGCTIIGELSQIPVDVARAQPSFCRIEPALPSKCWATVSSGSSKMCLLTKSRCPIWIQPEGRGTDGADQCPGPGGMPYGRLCSVPLWVRKFDALLTLRLRCVWAASAFFCPNRSGAWASPLLPSLDFLTVQMHYGPLSTHRGDTVCARI